MKARLFHIGSTGMAAYSLLITIPEDELEYHSHKISQLVGFLGLQELASEGKELYEVPEGLEFQEFGTKAAERFDSYIKKVKREKAFLKIYFDFDESKKIDIEDALKPFAPFKWESIQSKDYVEEYKKHVKGNYIGKDIWVGPPWDIPHPQQSTLKKYIVEPGLGFGTGEHPTTQMCLLGLQELSTKIQPQNVVDLGCGSGILTMACLDFFPKAKIWALDIDPLCKEEVEKNFKLNSKDLNNIQCMFGPQATLSTFQKQEARPIDLLISNIYVNVLIDLLPQIEKSVAHNGYWLLSGILEDGSQKQLIKAAEAKFKLLSQKCQAHSQNPDEIWLSMLWQKS